MDNPTDKTLNNLIVAAKHGTELFAKADPSWRAAEYGNRMEVYIAGQCFTETPESCLMAAVRLIHSGVAGLKLAPRGDYYVQTRKFGRIQLLDKPDGRVFLRYKVDDFVDLQMPVDDVIEFLLKVAMLR